MMRHTKSLRVLLVHALFLLMTGHAFSQYTNFDKGFKEGYNKGYCYTSSPQIICTPPVFTPLAPIPRYPESSNSWQDGYNRGFIIGIDKRKADDAQRNSSSSSRPTQFNPYIPQSPYIGQTTEQAMAYNQAMQQSSGSIVGSSIGLLLLLVKAFEVDPERQYQRKMKRLTKEAQKQRLKDAKKSKNKSGRKKQKRKDK